MLAIDRDGCLVGVLGDFEAGHPQNYKTAEMPIIKEVQAKLEGIPFVCISNQQGIQRGYTRQELVVEQFHWLMDSYPSCVGSIFCPDDGKLAVIIQRIGTYPWHKYSKFSWFGGNYLNTNFRKPNPGMAIIAKEYGWHLTKYVGDLSGRPDYADGRDSDHQFALNAGLEYMDIQEFLSSGN